MPDWPHAPVHRLDAEGAYMVTAGTYQKAHFFRDHDRLSMLQDRLLSVVQEHSWKLQAWAIFSNLYHFVTLSPGPPASLRWLIQELHSVTAYPWCSAGWCEQAASPAFYKTVSTFKIDRVTVPNEFEVEMHDAHP